MTPRPLLRLEGAAVLAASLYAFQRAQGSSVLFAVLFLAPDLSMAGYAMNPRAGSIAYNAVHTYVGPLLLGAYSLASGRHTAWLMALIWIAHIGFDRLLGYGLKYPTRFKDTHLNTARHSLDPAGSRS